MIPGGVLPIALALVLGGAGVTQPGGEGSASGAPRAIIRGSATWYGTGPGAGDAAAGPKLRRLLGKRWRGTEVRVCRTHGACVIVRLTDWCKCRGRRIIDLSDEDFRRLGPLSRGVLEVKVKV